MTAEQSIVFITGANRGIGRAFVERYLAHGAKKIYAAARNLDDLKSVVALDPQKVVAVQLDVTNAAQIAAAASIATDVDVLINNAGAATFGSILDLPTPEHNRDFDVNFFGLIGVTRAFAPIIKANGGGSVTNILSVVALANMPIGAGYSASKAPAWSATQAFRASLAKDNIRVTAVFPGPIDTDMAKGLDWPKTAPSVVAEKVIAGIAAGEEDIFPDPMSAEVGTTWRTSPKAVEANFASFAL